MQFFPENFAHGFQENQLVIPIRLHHVTGHPVHHGRHFRNRRKEDERTLRKRLRRELRFVRKTSAQNNDLRESANPSSRADETNRTLTDVIPQEFSGDDEESGEDYVDENEMHLDHKFANFSVTAFGEEFRLHLTPYDEFLAPNYTLHYMGDAEKEGFRGAEWDVPRHCFYSGHVNGRPDHRAVLSVCRGLVSTLFFQVKRPVWVECAVCAEVEQRFHCLIGSCDLAIHFFATCEKQFWNHKRISPITLKAFLRSRPQPSPMVPNLCRLMAPRRRAKYFASSRWQTNTKFP